MKGILYISLAKHNFTSNELDTLVCNASNYNQKYGITGYLYFEKGYFLQYIEGEESVIDVLIHTIQKDPRHEVINILEDQDIIARRFPTWHMHQLAKSSLIQLNIENILMDYMTNDSKQNNILLNSDHIWRIVYKLSTYRTEIIL